MGRLMHLGPPRPFISSDPGTRVHGHLTAFDLVRHARTEVVAENAPLAEADRVARLRVERLFERRLDDGYAQRAENRDGPSRRAR